MCVGQGEYKRESEKVRRGGGSRAAETESKRNANFPLWILGCISRLPLSLFLYFLKNRIERFTKLKIPLSHNFHTHTKKKSPADAPWSSISMMRRDNYE